MDGTKLLNFANKLEDENKDKGYKWLYDKLRYQIIKDQNQAINYTHSCTELSEHKCKFKYYPASDIKMCYCGKTKHLNA